MTNIDKVTVDNDLLNDIITKTWHDIENIKSQIEMLDNTDAKTVEFKKLLNTLLTNYYIFVGCIENIITDFDDAKQVVEPQETEEIKNIENISTAEPYSITTNNTQYDLKVHEDNFEPFEYFVDFDEPFGEKITDEDLYKI